jgi:protein required for attachment to host cells
MGPVFLAIADSVRSRIYRQESRGAPLHLVSDMAHPEAGMKNQELVTDKPGASRSGNNGSGYAGAHDSPRAREQEKFGHDIARHLEQARTSGQFKELVLVMGPRMLGHVRHGLSDASKAQIALVIDSDIARLDDGDIKAHLRKKWFVPEAVFAR